MFRVKKGECAARASVGACSFLMEVSPAVGGLCFSPFHDPVPGLFWARNFFCAAEKKGEAYKWIEFQNHNLAYSWKGL